MVGEESAGEDEARIASDHAGEWPVVEVRVGRNSLLEPEGRALGKEIHIVISVSLGHGKEVLEGREIHGRCVAGHVQVVAGIGRITLDDVVGPIQSTWRTKESQQVAQQVVTSWAGAANGEAWIERHGVANKYCTHYRQQTGQIETHPPDLVDGSHYLSHADNAGTRDIAMVCQGVQAGAGPSLVAFPKVRCDEPMVARDIDWGRERIEYKPLVDLLLDGLSKFL